MKINPYKQLVSAVCLIAFLWGCVKEEWDDCYDVYLAFECINPDYTFPETVRELELLFYNPAGNLVYDLSYTRSVLAASDWKINLTPVISKPGQYSVVALVNYQTETPLTLVGKEKKDKFLAEIRYDADRWVNYTVMDSYHGIYDLDFTDNSEETIIHTVPLSKNTNTIRLTIEFEDPEDARNLTSYRSYIQAENARYNWNYTIPAHEPVNYKPYESSFGDGQGIICDYLKTMRLHADGNLQLVMDFGGQGIPGPQVIDIPEKLALVEKDGTYIYDTNEKLEYYDYFEFIVRISSDFVIVGLIIDGWFLVTGNEEV
ncbi:MAG: FimB/Mfa2 family fimbrial subunit [Bacteroides sp.]|nr:FimB/Mfa2 family fimbrial subunit [Bacteroides sp.]